MNIRLGLVGRGPWGNVYAEELRALGIDSWHAGRDWKPEQDARYFKLDTSGVIVACASSAHYEVAKICLELGLPVLVEKPLCLSSKQALELVNMGGIGLVGHTRLYSPAWREFKASFLSHPPKHVEGWAGGVNATNTNAVWNWAPHLAAMCFDLGYDPRDAVLHMTEERQPLRFAADGREFTDGPPGALRVLITEFCDAIRKGVPDNAGISMGYETVKFTEELLAAK